MKTREIADLLSAELVGDGSVEIERVAALDTASDDEIAYAERAESVPGSRAACVIVSIGTELTTAQPQIRVKDPKLAFSIVAEKLHPPKRRGTEIHHSAVIADTAELGPGVFVGAFVCVGENSTVGGGTQIRAGAKVGDNVTIGQNCVLDPNVFIEDNCTIGDNVILHSGVIIGTDGFGYVRDGNGEHVKFPQIGTVVIEDNVEIGANSCVDRGALGETRIGEGTKIDNLVQIAHNVRIGKRVVIAAQSGIAGSSVLGDDVVLAGQVGIADHVRIEAGAVIAAKSVVFPNKVIKKGVWCGIPVQPLAEYSRQTVHQRNIGRLKDEVRELKRLVKQLTDPKEK